MTRFTNRLAIPKSAVMIFGFVVATFATCPADAQNVVSFTPPPGDEDVRFSYLTRLHQELHAQQQPSLQVAKMRAAELLHVRVADVTVIDLVYQSTSVEASMLDAETRRYIDQEAADGRAPKRERLQAFYQSRQEILRHAQERLILVLGHDKWDDIQRYIDDEFRVHIRRTGYSWTGNAKR